MTTSAEAALPAAAAAAGVGRDDVATLWRALACVADPEIPVVSVVELGIVRRVERLEDRWVITITPTYSGCPATRVIEADIVDAVTRATGSAPRVVTALAPAWTTDWIAPEARRALDAFGIVPPHSARPGPARGPQPLAFHRPMRDVRCPNCGSMRTSELSHFGSTACKAQYRCADCLEPFDYFKPH